MAENNEENDPFEEDIVFDQTGLLGTKPNRVQAAVAIIPTFMLFIRTLFLCVAFIGLGLCASTSQGILIHLELVVGVEAERALHIFTAHAIGMLFGGLLGSALFEIYNRQFLIFVSLIWMAVSISILPFTVSYSFLWTLATLGAIGAGMAFIFTGSSVLCLDLWGKMGGASLQALHFSFAFGAFIAPIIMHPFLTGQYSPHLNEVSTQNSSLKLPLQRMLRSLLDSDYLHMSTLDDNIENKIGELNLSLSLDDLTLPNLSKKNYSFDNFLTIENATTTTTETAKVDLNETSIRSPKPKPSFTNANLIPENSKWKRPPQKVSQPNPTEKIVAVQTNIVNTTAASSFVNETLTTSQNNLSIASQGSAFSHTSSLPLNEPQLTTTSSAKFSVTNITDGTTSIGTKLRPNKIDSGKNNISESVSSMTIVKPKLPAEITTELVLKVRANHTEIVNKTKTEIANQKFATDLNSVSAFDCNSSSRTNSNCESPTPSEPKVLDFKESYEGSGYIDPEDEFDAKYALDSEAPITTPSPENDMPSFIPKHKPKPGTFSNTSENDAHFIESIAKKFKNYGITSIHIIFICEGIFLLITAFTSVLIMCHSPREPRSRQEDTDITADIHKVRAIIFLTLISIFMFTAEALQGAVHHLLASSHMDNGLQLVITKSIDGQAIFWGLVCSMRFLCILLSGCLSVKPGKILVASSLFTVMGTIFMCIGTFNKEDFLLGGIVVIALGLAPILPTSFLWMAQQMKVTHRMCALMIIISSFGNSLTHISLTQVVANSHLYSYILIGISVSSLIFLIFSFIFLYKNHSSKSLAVPVGYQLANQEEEESMELRRHSSNYEQMEHRLHESHSLLID